jgi:transglutaminase-like putative cysteine protease
MTMSVDARIRGSVLLLLVVLLGADSSPTAARPLGAHGAGIALIASGVGNDYAVDDLVAFVREARIRDVIIDWAWITHHWEPTKFDEVNDLVEKLKRRGVRVAAMYRPRFKPHQIDKYPVAYQVDAKGEPRNGFCEIRYADAAARRWGTEWAVRILTRCPAIDEVVIYNPSQTCGSTEVTDARAKDPEFDHRCVRTFLEETRAAMCEVKKSARLGLVLSPDRALYEHYAQVVDVPRPFVFVREESDYAADRDRAREIAPDGPALAKITWGENDRVSDDRLGDFIRTARETRMRFVFWTFWSTFCEGTYDLDRLCRALGINARRIKLIIRDLGGKTGLRWPPAVVRKAIREAADETSSSHYQKMLAAAARYGEDAVGPLCRLLDDQNESTTVRWAAAGTLGQVGSTKALPCLLKHSRDEAPWVRWFCAEALGFCGGGSAAAQRRLAKMAETDPAWRPHEENDSGEWYVRDTARVALERLEKAAAPLREGVAVVAVKDFMRLENSGDEIENLEFPRYFPVIDSEQIVLGRWVTARTDDGKPVPIAIARVTPGPSGNLLHTWRLKRLPARTGVVVTVTSLALRRERPAPEGRFRIPALDKYPSDVVPFLRSTPSIAADHPEIRAAATKILAKTRDAYEVAATIAEMMKVKSYTPRGNPGLSLPAAVLTLRYGGSCCRSAVTAAAILRACGIPAQITYCPAGYIHGIVRFYLDGYGWCRMDATCGTGRLPLVTERDHRGLIRLYDMPIEMEQRPNTWGWPFEHNTVDGDYEFRSGGKVVRSVRFRARDEAQANRELRPSGEVTEPFHHLEPGSWHLLLAVEPWEIKDRTWAALVVESVDATRIGRIGEYTEVLGRLGAHAKEPWLGDLMSRLLEFGKLSDSR